MVDHEAIASMVRERFGNFIFERINPGAESRDQNNTTFDDATIREAAKIGLVGFTSPKKFGGGENSWEVWGHVLEEIGYLCEDSGLCMVLSYRESAVNLLNRSAPRRIVERYLPPAIAGERCLGWAYSEGQDPFSFTSTARREGDDFILSGVKQAVTGGFGDKAFIVYGVNEAKNDIIALMVERDDPGVELQPVPTMGLRSLGLARLFLHDVRVSKDRLVALSDGVSHAQIFINERRITGSCWILGRMRALFEKVVRHLDERIRYKQPLTEMQTVQAALGRMHIAIETSRLYVHNMLAGTGRSDIDYLWDPQVAKAKYFLTEQALKVAQTAQHILGGYGYMQEYGFDRYLRDFYGLVPIIGTQYTLEVDIGIRAVQQLRDQRSESQKLMEAAQ